MTPLEEIEAAAKQLSRSEQEALIMSLQRERTARPTSAERVRVKFPLIECGPPGSIDITPELLAELEIQHDLERYAASLRPRDAC